MDTGLRVHPRGTELAYEELDDELFALIRTRNQKVGRLFAQASRDVEWTRDAPIRVHTTMLGVHGPDALKTTSTLVEK